MTLEVNPISSLNSAVIFDLTIKHEIHGIPDLLRSEQLSKKMQASSVTSAAIESLTPTSQEQTNPLNMMFLKRCIAPLINFRTLAPYISLN